MENYKIFVFLKNIVTGIEIDGFSNWQIRMKIVKMYNTYYSYSLPIDQSDHFYIYVIKTGTVMYLKLKHSFFV